MSHWSPNPNNLFTFRASGAGNMGDVTDKTSVARFKLPERFVLIYVKGLWTGGTGSATLAMKLDHWSNIQDYDFTEESWASMGVGGSSVLDFRVPADEYARYTYMPGDELVFEWTNPSTTRWGIEVGLIAANQDG